MAGCEWRERKPQSPHLKNEANALLRGLLWGIHWYDEGSWQCFCPLTASTPSPGFLFASLQAYELSYNFSVLQQGKTTV